MKFSSLAVAAVFFASRAEAFAGPSLKPRFGVQVRLLADSTCSVEFSENPT